jgi:hypothetical protein
MRGATGSTGTLLFQTSTRWAHKGINAVVVAQTCTLFALSPFIDPNVMSPVAAGIITASVAGVFTFLRRLGRVFFVFVFHTT